LCQVVGAEQGAPAGLRAVDGGIAAEVTRVEEGGEVEESFGVVDFVASLIESVGLAPERRPGMRRAGPWQGEY
jgi:hypothetical protein